MHFCRPESGAPIVKEGKAVGKFRHAVGEWGMGLLRLDRCAGRGE